MRRFIWFPTFFLMIILMTSCSEQVESPVTKLNIEPYGLKEKEEILIQKTGVQFIEYFKLNGTLEKEDDLIYEVEVYKNGKKESNALVSKGEINSKFKDEIISFGTIDNNSKPKKLTILAGQPGSLSSTDIEHEMTLIGYQKLLEEKVTLEKDKPVYLAAWVGTSKNSMETFGSQNGELPEGLENSELAILYKVTLVKEK